MARLIINRTCPECKKQVDEVPDLLLRKEGDKYNVEFIHLKRGIKQYYHTTCWNQMIIKQHTRYREKNKKRLAKKETS